MNFSRPFLRSAVGIALLLTAVSLAAEKTRPVISQAQSCKTYVQRFYAWYFPAMQHPGNKVMSDVALDRKGFLFSTELRKALRDDLAASKKNKAEIVGLDFDPFLNTQDPSEKYVVGTVRVADGKCSADIHSVDNGKKSDQPDVVPELENREGKWVFINFLYPTSEKPEDRDLLSVLKTLREQRTAKH